MAPDTDGPVSTVESVASTAHDWLVAHLDAFDPLETEPFKAVTARQKAFGELSHALRVREAHAEVASELESFVVDTVDDPAYYSRLRRSPRRVLDVGTPLVYTARRDSLSSAARTVVETALQSDAAWNVERDPYEQLELSWLATLMPGVQLDHSREQVIERSFLARPPDPILVDDMEAYKLTHDFYFAFDYGLETAGFPTLPADASVDDAIRGLVVRTLAREQTDLLVELLAVGSLQGAISQRLFTVAVDQLAEACEPDHLPGPELSDRGDDSVSHGDFGDVSDAHRHWAENYHTNVVAAMLLPVAASRYASLPGPATVTAEYRRAVTALGRALSALANYKLRTGAKLLEAAVSAGIPAPFESTLQRCREYLASQRRPDGTFGYWWDERTASRANGAEPDFDELIERTTQRCDRTLDVIDANHS